jgi:hypothetical protein
MKKISLMLAVASTFFCFIGASFAYGGGTLRYFDGKEVLAKEVRIEKMQTGNLEPDKADNIQYPSYMTAGLTVFTVPSSGMSLTFSEGLGVLYRFQYENGAYAWKLYESATLLDGVYACILMNDNAWAMEMNYRPVSYVLKGTISNPAHYLFQFGEVTEAEFLSMGVMGAEQLPKESGAIYNYAYVANSTTMTVDRICSIDNTVSQELDGSLMIINILAVVMPSDEEGFLSRILLSEEAKLSKEKLRDGQLFGLIIRKTPYPYY